jgi:hypothetical protein
MQSITDATTKSLSRNSLLESYVIRKRSCVVWRGAVGKVSFGNSLAAYPTVRTVLRGGRGLYLKPSPLPDGSATRPCTCPARQLMSPKAPRRLGMRPPLKIFCDAHKRSGDWGWGGSKGRSCCSQLTRHRSGQPKALCC